jgi:CheY-like chemotaxis protein
MLQEQEFDCIILDRYLPSDDPKSESGGDGLELLKGLRDGTIGQRIGKPHVRTLPVCLCSAAARSLDLSSFSREQLANVEVMSKLMHNRLLAWIQAQDQLRTNAN